MSKRTELSGSALDNVAGGRFEPDETTMEMVFTSELTGESTTYIMKDADKVYNTIMSTYDPNKSPIDNDEAILKALLSGNLIELK